MRVLFDQGTSVPLRRYLIDHTVTTVFEKGWSRLQNGELLQAAQAEAFEVLVTTDQNLKYQQNLRNNPIAIVILPTTSWPVIEQRVNLIVDAFNKIGPGTYVEIEF